MAEFFSADLHFGHARILELSAARAATFASIEAMDETLIDNWNSVVGPHDHVWVLGDYDMYGKDEHLKYLNRLNGSKTLVTGNHDACAGLSRDGWKHTQRYIAAGFVGVNDYATTTLPAVTPKSNNTRVMLSHYPYAPESPEDRRDRYAQVRLRDLGLPLLHGHVHERFREGFSPAGTPMINVGVDVWQYFPVAGTTLTLTIAAMADDSIDGTAQLNAETHDAPLVEGDT